MPTPLEDYLFDLRGFLILREALAPDEVAKLNDHIDAVPTLERGQWHGAVHRQDQPESSGINLHQVYEAGVPFEALIDHPSWISHVTRYVGGDDGLFIDENFVNLRGIGTAIQLHSGAHKRRIRTQFRFHNNEFRCGQINVLMALSDIGSGDGATMVIPGSHKSNLMHPQYQPGYGGDTSVDGVEGAIEVHLKSGDAIVFVDALSHGSAQRVNPGQRRIAIYRYGPHWGNTRYGYLPSRELLERLTPERRNIVQPIPPLCPPSR
ncbi:MAG TPA: phytanoyl-CoA dioxygenase family protein [Abditibacteriaceae bacterium]|nr:phytanoyl-CoA dioxygenase family protein [Abditibacteriaceae bacterium]